MSQPATTNQPQRHWREAERRSVAFTAANASAAVEYDVYGTDHERNALCVFAVLAPSAQRAIECASAVGVQAELCVGVVESGSDWRMDRTYTSVPGHARDNGYAPVESTPMFPAKSERRPTPARTINEADVAAPEPTGTTNYFLLLVVAFNVLVILLLTLCVFLAE